MTKKTIKEYAEQAKKYKKVLAKTGRTTSRRTYTQRNDMRSRDYELKIWEELISRKIIGKDKLFKKLTELENTVLKDQTYADITLYSKGKPVAGLKMFECIPKHGYDTADFWIGTEIDPSSFPTHVKSFEAQMINNGVYSVKPVQNPTKKCEVTSVEITYSFV